MFSMCVNIVDRVEIVVVSIFMDTSGHEHVCKTCNHSVY